MFFYYIFFLARHLWKKVCSSHFSASRQLAVWFGLVKRTRGSQLLIQIQFKSKPPTKGYHKFISRRCSRPPFFLGGGLEPARAATDMEDTENHLPCGVFRLELGATSVPILVRCPATQSPLETERGNHTRLLYHEVVDGRPFPSQPNAPVIGAPMGPGDFLGGLTSTLPFHQIEVSTKTGGTSQNACGICPISLNRVLNFSPALAGAQ